VSGPRRYKCLYCEGAVEAEQRVRAIVMTCYTDERAFHGECLKKLQTTGRHPRRPSVRYGVVKIEQ
jgi:hypothetical protein